MSDRWRRIRGTVLTGLMWAAACAPVTIIVGTQIVDPTDTMDEMW
ncbi:MAG: hypothetical protein ABI120_08220 [Gemmatimonadaceae bacterium]